MGVCVAVVRYWEKGYRRPAVWQYPEIFRFLGRDPRPPATDSGEVLLRWCQYRGWTRRRLATCLGVDEATLVALGVGRPLSGERAWKPLTSKQCG